MTTQIPAWLATLDEDDIRFLYRFVVASGSLKQLAKDYGVSYPTVRTRLDRLIEKVKIAESSEKLDPFERSLKLLVADGQVPLAAAKRLLAAHKSTCNENSSSSKR